MANLPVAASVWAAPIWVMSASRFIISREVLLLEAISILHRRVRTDVTDFSPQLTDSPTFWHPPDRSQAAFIAANATVIGDVTIAPGVSIWYGAVVRGDVEKIAIGEGSNVQDGAILHGDLGEPTVLAEYVTVGHRAVIHSAYIERGSLIGIGAIVLNGVRIGAGSMIGAGAVVTKSVPARSLVVGVPGKVVRELSDEEVHHLIEHAQNYQKLALVHANQGTDLGFTKR